MLLSLLFCCAHARLANLTGYFFWPILCICDQSRTGSTQSSMACTLEAATAVATGRCTGRSESKEATESSESEPEVQLWKPDQSLHGSMEAAESKEGFMVYLVEKQRLDVVCVCGYVWVMAVLHELVLFAGTCNKSGLQSTFFISTARTQIKSRSKPTRVSTPLSLGRLRPRSCLDAQRSSMTPQ